MKQISVYISILARALLPSFQNIENFLSPKSSGRSLSLRRNFNRTMSSNTPITMKRTVIMP